MGFEMMMRQKIQPFSKLIFTSILFYGISSCKQRAFNNKNPDNSVKSVYSFDEKKLIDSHFVANVKVGSDGAQYQCWYVLAMKRTQGSPSGLTNEQLAAEAEAQKANFKPLPLGAPRLLYFHADLIVAELEKIRAPIQGEAASELNARNVAINRIKEVLSKLAKAIRDGKASASLGSQSNIRAIYNAGIREANEHVDLYNVYTKIAQDINKMRDNSVKGEVLSITQLQNLRRTTPLASRALETALANLTSTMKEGQAGSPGPCEPTPLFGAHP
jgi:hypothetical protein